MPLEFYYQVIVSNIRQMILENYFKLNICIKYFNAPTILPSMNSKQLFLENVVKLFVLNTLHFSTPAILPSMNSKEVFLENVVKLFYL